jgi:NAD(P)-dependent dehydrogenase (short-subunit alcohol dehydrogenase family)
MWHISAAEFDAVIDINIKGTANVIRHFLPLMKQGIIVNLSSGWGRVGDPDVSLKILFCFSFLL